MLAWMQGKAPVGAWVGREEGGRGEQEKGISDWPDAGWDCERTSDLDASLVLFSVSVSCRPALLLHLGMTRKY